MRLAFARRACEAYLASLENYITAHEALLDETLYEEAIDVATEAMRKAT